MFKKIILGTLTVGMIVFLVIGAINRTQAKAGDSDSGTGVARQQAAGMALADEGSGQGRGGWGRAQEETRGETVQSQGNAVGRQGNTDDVQGGKGWGNNSGVTEPQADVSEWETVQGRVAAIADDLLSIETDAGEQIAIEGRPLLYLQETGFAPQVGDSVTVTGFYEDGEFKVGEIVNSNTGQGSQVRDASGRPMWAGRGRRS